MMSCQISKEDLEFKTQVENCSFPISEFNHRAHLRLAYIYLSEHSFAQAVALMRESLVRLLAFNNVDPAKYHETLTQAWLLLVEGRMASQVTDNADAFIDLHVDLLSFQLMLQFYSETLLFSEQAREAFVAPDLRSFILIGEIL